MQIIGLAGFKTSGKDTAYQLIRDALPGAKVERAAFADKLKIMAGRAIGLDGSDEQMIHAMNDFKENGILTGSADTFHTSITGRQYLQDFGQKAREVFGDTFWIDQVLPDDPITLQFKYSTVDVLCVTDVRYPNEAQRIRDLGGCVWEIVRPGLESDGHASETPLPRTLLERTIYNHATIPEFGELLEQSIKEVIPNAGY